MDAGYDAESGESTSTQLLKAATEAMAGNTLAYKLEFYSDRVYQLGDILTCRIGEIVTRAVLTYARRSSRDNRIFYRAGRAVLTLTDILRQQDEEEKKTGAKLSGKSSSGHTHDNRYYTEAEVKDLLNGLLSITSVSGSAYVAGSSSSNELSISISQSGYTPIGIVGHSVSGDRTTFLILARAYVKNGNSIVYILRNTHTTATGSDSTINFSVLWRKNQ